MGKGKGSNRAFNNFKKPNIDHFAHQLHVKGTGPHKNVKKYSRKFNKKKVQEVINDELERQRLLEETTLEDNAKQMPDDDGGDE